MRRTSLTMLLAAAALQVVTPGSHGAGAAERGGRSASARPAEDATSLDQKRQQLIERETALKAKEEALKKLSATLEARVAELNAAKKGLEAMVVKKRLDEERYKKMIKIYKGLKPNQAADLLNKLDDKMVIELLNQMDQKTLVKLIPFMNQPRVLEWTRLKLQGT